MDPKRYSRLHIAQGLLAVASFGQSVPPAEGPPESPAPLREAPAASQAAPDPQRKSSPWTKAGVDIYLLGDFYADANFNHPASGRNQLYNFDIRANQAHLNMAKLSFERAAAPIGFRVDLGVGNAFDIASATDKAPNGFKYVEQMYLTVKAPRTRGIELAFGKFATSAGAEVIGTHLNWNYSRSLLFAWAIPYYHFGFRATIPVTETFSAGMQVVNGWNNLVDNNGSKTIGVVGTFAWKRVFWSNTYYTGPEKDATNEGYRQLYDTALTLAPSGKVSAYLNFDYGADKNIGPGSQRWTGFAGAFRYQFTDRFAIAPRVEVFDDMDGFATGTAQILKEFTLTGEVKIASGVLSRLEFRRDVSDKPYFDQRHRAMVATSQTTVTLGLIAFFGPKK